MMLLTGYSSWVSTSVFPGGRGISCSLLPLQQVHCTDLLLWACSGVPVQGYDLVFYTFFLSIFVFLFFVDQFQAGMDGN